jgi:hypothetical protein
MIFCRLPLLRPPLALLLSLTLDAVVEVQAAGGARPRNTLRLAAGTP